MPATTPGGWPYVLPADHPLEFPASSQNQANLLETRIGAGKAGMAPDEAGARRIMKLTNYGPVSNASVWKIGSAWTGVSPGDTGNTGLLTYGAGVITASQDCVLDMGVQVYWADNPTGLRWLIIYINNVGVYQESRPSALSLANSLSMPGTFVAAGSAMQIAVYQNSGGTLLIQEARWNVRRVASS